MKELKNISDAVCRGDLKKLKGVKIKWKPLKNL